MSSREPHSALTPNVSIFPPQPNSRSLLQQHRDLPPEFPGEPKGLRARGVQFVDQNAGLLLIALAQVFFALMNLVTKKLSSIDPPIATLELVFVRMSITYICCVVYMVTQRVPHPFLGPPGVRLLLAFRGFVGFIGLFGLYYSLQYLSLSDAIVLTFLAPVFTGFTGAFFLKEPFSRKEAFAGVFSLTGVILIARPAFLFGTSTHSLVTAPDSGERGTPHQRLVAIGVALIGVLGATGAFTSIRAIGKRAHPLHNVAYFSQQCVVASSIGMVIMQEPFIVPTRLDWFVMLLLLGAFGFMAQLLLTMGLQRETAGRGTLGVFSQIVFATILQYIFFGSTPGILSILGTVIIIASAIYVALTKENISGKINALPLQSANSVEQGLLEDDIDIEDT